MRKYLFFAMFAAAGLVTGMTACSSDDDNPVDRPIDSGTVISWDAPRFFQNAIVSSDAEDSSFEGFHWGKELYPDTDPGHLYLGVDTWEEAERIFRRYWLAPNVKPTLLPPGPKALKAPLPDMNGVEKMHLLLQPGETEDVVAEVTVSDPKMLKHFYKITFLKNSAWPDEPAKAGRRASKKYNWHVGDVVKNVTLTVEDEEESYLDDDDKTKDFVCIRSSGNGVNPWFVTVTKHNTYRGGNADLYPTYAHIRRMKYTPTYDTSVEIDSMMHDNWNLIKNAWSECSNIGSFPGTASDNEPYIDSCEDDWSHQRHTYNFDEGEVVGLSSSGKSSFFFEFDIYEDDEVEDNMSVYRTMRSKATNKEGNTCSTCSSKWY